MNRQSSTLNRLRHSVHGVGLSLVAMAVTITGPIGCGASPVSSSAHHDIGIDGGIDGGMDGGDDGGSTSSGGTSSGGTSSGGTSSGGTSSGGTSSGGSGDGWSTDGSGSAPSSRMKVPEQTDEAYVTKAWEGSADFELDAWMTLPAVHVSHILMIQTGADPTAPDAMSMPGSNLMIYATTDDPHIKYYAWSYAPSNGCGAGADGSDLWGSHTAYDGGCYTISGGMPSQAGPPQTGRAEEVLDWALFGREAADLAPTDEYDVPNYNYSDSPVHHESEFVKHVSFIAVGAAIAAAWSPATGALVAGGGCCAPVASACGTLLMAANAAFVVLYEGLTGAPGFYLEMIFTAGALTGAVEGAAKLRAAATAFWTAVRAAAVGCFSSAVACGVCISTDCSLSVTGVTAPACLKDIAGMGWLVTGVLASLGFAGWLTWSFVAPEYADFAGVGGSHAD